MTTFTCIQEMVLQAHARLHRSVWDFVMGGAESETTLRRNRLAWDRIAFNPQVFNDVGDISLTSELLGYQQRLPLVLAPMGSVHLVDDRAALSPIGAAHEFGCLSFLSGVADPGLCEVMRHPHGAVVYTIYVTGDDAWLDRKVSEACELGVAAIALLADTAYFGRRERDLLNHFSSKVANVRTRSQDTDQHFAARLSWSTVERIKHRSGLPLVVKGIVTAHDAKRAVDHGVDVVYVSNHGGRQLDHLPGTGEVLNAVVESLAGKAGLIVDGGIWRGSDVVKALALGVDAVGIGRLQALALACGGKQALIHALEILEYEMTVTLGLLGVCDIHQLSPKHLVAGTLVDNPSVLSTLPVASQRLGY